jgi:DNA polymerase-4
MDAFYASVEQRDRPELAGRPVVVGADPRGRGVVSAASYEARRFGIHSAMPIGRAYRLCPAAAFLPVDMDKYARESERIMAILADFTPLVEPLSLDEAFLDVTASRALHGAGVEIARRIKARIRSEVGLTASAGVAPNKFLAKNASAWRKPDGLTVIAPERVESFLQQLPVDALWGVGPVTAERLRQRGILRLVDVRTAEPAVLREAVGSLADWLVKLAAGEDDRPVEPNRPSKSSSSECTYARDLVDVARIRDEIATMARDNAGWLQRRNILARTVTIKVRYDDFTTITRSDTKPPTNDPDDIARRAVDLLARTDAGKRPVRLLGAGVHNLSSAEPSPGDDGSRLPFGG